MTRENQSVGFFVGTNVLDHPICLKCHNHDKADKKKILGKRKKDQDRDNDDGLSSLQKKPRVAWSIDLHRKFVAAVNQLGLEKAVPRKIHQLMNVEGLTRENVSSHLQKYRLKLKNETQQASIVANNGYAEFCSLSGKIPSPTLQSYASDGNFGLLNSPSDLNMKDISFSDSLIWPVEPENINNICSLSNIGTIQPSMFPSNQSSNLLPGISTSSELNQLNQIEFSEFAPTSSFANSNVNNSLTYVSSDDLMIQEYLQQTHNTGAFSDESWAGNELFDMECNWFPENWHGEAELPEFSLNSWLECVDTFNSNCYSSTDSSPISVFPLEDNKYEQIL